jgi:hypothetical protein
MPAGATQQAWWGYWAVIDDAAEDEGAEYAQHLEDVAESDDPESYR